MTIQQNFLFCALLLIICAVGAQKKTAFDKNQLPPSYIPSGKTIYVQ